jgi:hypothetical protein
VNRNVSCSGLARGAGHDRLRQAAPAVRRRRVDALDLVGVRRRSSRHIETGARLASAQNARAPVSQARWRSQRSIAVDRVVAPHGSERIHSSRSGQTSSGATSVTAVGASGGGRSQRHQAGAG